MKRRSISGGVPRGKRLLVPTGWLAVAAAAGVEFVSNVDDVAGKLVDNGDGPQARAWYLHGPASDKVLAGADLSRGVP